MSNKIRFPKVYDPNSIFRMNSQTEIIITEIGKGDSYFPRRAEFEGKKGHLIKLLPKRSTGPYKDWQSGYVNMDSYSLCLLAFKFTLVPEQPSYLETFI